MSAKRRYKKHLGRIKTGAVSVFSGRGLDGSGGIFLDTRFSTTVSDIPILLPGSR